MSTVPVVGLALGPVAGLGAARCVTSHYSVMVKELSQLFVAGPPDIIDEESTFQKLTERDPRVQQLLSAQDKALLGQDGGQLLAVNADTGEIEHRIDLTMLPAWDGLVGANGRLFLSTLDGQVLCFGE